jgi:hypothetical protein
VINSNRSSGGFHSRGPDPMRDCQLRKKLLGGKKGWWGGWGGRQHSRRQQSSEILCDRAAPRCVELLESPVSGLFPFLPIFQNNATQTRGRTNHVGLANICRCRPDQTALHLTGRSRSHEKKTQNHDEKLVCKRLWGGGGFARQWPACSSLRVIKASQSGLHADNLILCDNERLMIYQVCPQ